MDNLCDIAWQNAKELDAVARSPSKFKQADLTRALKAAKAAGIEIVRIKIGSDGSIEIDTCKAPEPQNDFDKWKAAHAD